MIYFTHQFSDGSELQVHMKPGKFTTRVWGTINGAETRGYSVPNDSVRDGALKEIVRSEAILHVINNMGLGRTSDLDGHEYEMAKVEAAITKIPSIKKQASSDPVEEETA